jgi:hypothetical protein
MLAEIYLSFCLFQPLNRPDFGPNYPGNPGYPSNPTGGYPTYTNLEGWITLGRILRVPRVCP